MTKKKTESWHEADHSPHTSAKVKNDWSYTSPPTVCLRGVQKDSLPFTLSWIYNYKPSLIAFLVQPCSWTNGKDALNIFFFISSSCFVLSSSWDDEELPWVVSLLCLRLIRNPRKPTKQVNHVTTDINRNMILCNKTMEHR